MVLTTVDAAHSGGSGTAANVQDLINQNRFGRWQWGIFAMCFIIVLLDGFDTAAIGYIAPSLLKEWGLTKAALGPVLSAALFGLAGGALLAGPLADRWGRKLVVIASVVVFGVSSLACALSQNIEQLSFLRFITGLGLGAAMPNAVTLTSEYCPDARRSTLTNLLFCGFPLGAAFGGFLAAWMIPNWGWHSVLILGGITPLLLAVLLILRLPESVRYLVTHKAPIDKLKAIMAHIAGQAAVVKVQRFVLTEHRPVTNERGGLAQVLAGPYRIGSLMLWTAYFMGLVIFYALMNWMPLLFKESGMSPQSATLITALFPLGGVGSVLLGWWMDRFEANRLLSIGFLLTAIGVWSIAQAVGHVGWLVVVVFVAGTVMNASQSSLPALAVAFYPTNARATGVAWMLGIGRFGGIAGSFLVAGLSALDLSVPQIFTVIAIPGILASVALMIKRFTDPASARQRAKLTQTPHDSGAVSAPQGASH